MSEPSTQLPLARVTALRDRVAALESLERGAEPFVDMLAGDGTKLAKAAKKWLADKSALLSPPSMRCKCVCHRDDPMSEVCLDCCKEIPENAPSVREEPPHKFDCGLNRGWMECSCGAQTAKEGKR